jgi:ligand-binding sensor domain-containing protein
MRPAGISTSGRWARWAAVVLLACALPARASDDDPPSRAGAVAFRRLAVPDGVAGRFPTAFAEDRAGFLWIGTGDGLVRFDGTRFKVFRSRLGDPATLGGDEVRALAAAADGRLWVGTAGGGLSVYDPATEAFTRFRHDPRDPNSLAHDRIWGLAEDRFGRIWVATPAGLDRLNPRTGRLRHFRHEPFDPASLASDRVGAVLADSKGRIWVGSGGGLQVWRGSPAGAEGGRQGRFERVASTPGSDSLAGQLVVRLFEDRRGDIWVGTAKHGAAVVDPDFKSLRRLPLEPRTSAANWSNPRDAGGGPGPDEWLRRVRIQGFAAAGQDEVWIATAGGGVAVVDVESRRVIDRLRHDPSQPGTPDGDDVRALLADRAGGIWLGAWNGGIARHDLATRGVRVLRHSPGSAEGLSHPAAVLPLVSPNQSLCWVGTGGNGVDVFTRGLRRIGGLRADPADPAALSDGTVTWMGWSYAGDAVWVATGDGTLHRVDPGALLMRGDRVQIGTAPRVTARLTAADGLPAGPVRGLLTDGDRALWVGAAGGLARVDPVTSAVTVFRDAALDGAIQALAHANDGTFWVATDHGLVRFDPATGRALRARHEPGRPDSLPDDRVTDLLVADDLRLWVATRGGAAVLRSWDRETGAAVFEPVAERIERPADPVESLIQDPGGHMWLGPRRRVDPRTWRVRDLGPDEGLDLPGFFPASSAQWLERTLLFGSPEGLLLVDIDRLPSAAYEPPVAAVALQVDGVERPGAAGLPETGLTLRSGDSFRLDVAALDFTAPEKAVYRHRLEGFDPTWSGTTRGAVAYADLPPGSYELHVQGTNHAGRWSPHELVVPVTVLPAPYQTTGFRAGLLVLALAVLAAVVTVWVRRRRAVARHY